MAEHVFEKSSSITFYQEHQESRYQQLKSETIQKLSILGTKIDHCLDIPIATLESEENISLLLKSIQLIHQELLNLKKDVLLLKEYSSSSTLES